MVPVEDDDAAEGPAGVDVLVRLSHLRPGDAIDVLPPSGTFTADLFTPADHVFVVAGFGIWKSASERKSGRSAASRASTASKHAPGQQHPPTRRARPRSRMRDEG